MIVDVESMKAIENNTGLPTDVLMEKAGAALFDYIKDEVFPSQTITILCGKGNNGGDGFVLARLLHENGYKVQCFLTHDIPVSKEALKAYKKLDSSLITSSSSKKVLKHTDVFIDCVFGFSFHGSLDEKTRKLFDEINHSSIPLISVDVNSGVEADTGKADRFALRSSITLALDCYKICHMMRKDHQLFNKVVLLPLGFPHPETSSVHEMNEALFFSSFPRKTETSYKGSNGKAYLIGGCFGMAGAVSLNIIGAKTVGASYLHVSVPENIYPIVASQHITPVFHPFGNETVEKVIEPYLSQVNAIGFGSGATFMEGKEAILDLLLQKGETPIVLDAEALRLLVHNTWVLRFAHSPLILTPHIKEFADMINKPIEVVQDDKIHLVKEFASMYHCTVVLKGPNTIVASPKGELYINQTGNEALGQAGSGDVLTGILTALLASQKDIFNAVIMGVWLHGYIADVATEVHSKQNFSLLDYPFIMDKIFKKNGF